MCIGGKIFLQSFVIHRKENVRYKSYAIYILQISWNKISLNQPVVVENYEFELPPPIHCSVRLSNTSILDSGLSRSTITVARRGNISHDMINLAITKHTRTSCSACHELSNRRLSPTFRIVYFEKARCWRPHNHQSAVYLGGERMSE